MPLGSYLTHFLSTAKENMYSKSPSDLTVRRACIQDVPVILDFIRNNGRQRQFYPSYTERDITGTGLLKDLTIEDIFLAFEGPRIVGTLTAWDQTGFRQWYLNDQEAVLDPLDKYGNNNNWPQPDPKTPFNERILALICIKDDRPIVFTKLLRAVKEVYNDPASPSYLWLGLHENDPLKEAIKHEKYFRMTSHIFLVFWQEDEMDANRLKGGVPYLELGSL